MTEEKNIIKEIILYPDRAYVTRIENPELKKGKVDFIFHHLPPQIIKDSLNVKILGKFHAKIEGIDLKEEMLEEYSNEDIRKIYACLDDQENELKKIQDKLVQLNKQEELLKNVQKINNINLMNEFYNKISDINEFNNLLNFFSTNLNNINDDMLVLITNKNKIEAKINTLRSELENKKNSRYKKVINASVSLNIENDNIYEISLSYIVLNASWQPIYDVRVFFKTNEIELYYYGEASQLSGENWKNAQIYLSTANPSIGASIPQITPRYLTTETYYYGGSKGISGGMPGSAATGKSIIAEEPEANVEKAGLNVNFKILNPETINSDGTKKRLLISKSKFPVSFEYKTIPKQIENVFVNGSIINTNDYPFLAGIIKVFHENDYIGDSYTKTIVPNEKMLLSLGIDDGIKIKRERINKYRSTKGLTGGNEMYEYEYKITIENFKKSDEGVKILEPVPISKNKEIKCKFEFITDKLLPNDLGIIEWNKQIKSEEKLELKLKFSIEYPKNRQITGLE